MQNKALQTGFTFYPNPSSNQIFVNQLNGESIISIYNLSGQLIYQNKTSSTNETIDVYGFTNGLYILKVENNGELYTQKMMVNKH